MTATRPPDGPGPLARPGGRALRAPPIRVRLTFWYTAVLAAFLLGMAGVTYSVLERLAARETERALGETAATAMISLRVLGTATPPASRSQVLAATANRLRYPDRRILLYDDGRLVAASGVPEDAPRAAPFLVPPDAPALLAAIRAGRRDALLAPPAPGAAPVRAYIRLPRFAHGRFAVVVLGSTEAERRLLHALRAYLFFFVPLALLLAAIVGYLLAAKILAPISAMTRQAERIGATNLDERLPVANPADELGRLARVLNSLLSRLHDAFEQQRRFMADAAHELRTPVAVIRGEAEVTLARPERPEPEYRDALDVVAGESARLSGIVDDLFTLARADAGQLPLRREPVYLDELVAETARAIATLAARKDITVRVETPDELPFAGDEALLRRMLTNLLDNAVKYTPRGGQVGVSAERVGERYRIAVKDTGPGVPDQDRERIFDRFHRVDTARSRAAGASGDSLAGGAGLGLPIARWIARAHGGNLELADSSAAGSTFVAELPVGAAPTPPPASPSARPPAAAQSAESAPGRDGAR